MVYVSLISGVEGADVHQPRTWRISYFKPENVLNGHVP